MTTTLTEQESGMMIGATTRPPVPFANLTEAQYLAMWRRLELLEHYRQRGREVQILEAQLQADPVNEYIPAPHVFGNGGTGAPPRYAGGTLTASILEVMRQRGAVMRPSEIAAALEKSAAAISNEFTKDNKLPKSERKFEKLAQGEWQPAGGF